MHKYLKKLLSISSPALLDKTPYIESTYVGSLGSKGEEIFNILTIKNGFLAFESALHFFHASESSSEDNININIWNRNEIWKSDYECLDDDLFFFAEDVFGGQFCLKDDKIFSFDPETGDLEELANDFNEWTKLILDDYDFMTGFSLAHEWQSRYGCLPSGKRLLPKKLFVFGGELSIDNLYLSDAVQGMKYRAVFANKIHNLPDGAEIRIRVE